MEVSGQPLEITVGHYLRQHLITRRDPLPDRELFIVENSEQPLYHPFILSVSNKIQLPSLKHLREINQERSAVQQMFHTIDNQIRCVPISVPSLDHILQYLQRRDPHPVQQLCFIIDICLQFQVEGRNSPCLEFLGEMEQEGAGSLVLAGGVDDLLSPAGGDVVVVRVIDRVVPLVELLWNDEVVLREVLWGLREPSFGVVEVCFQEREGEVPCLFES